MAVVRSRMVRACGLIDVVDGPFRRMRGVAKLGRDSSTTQGDNWDGQEIKPKVSATKIM